MRIWKTCAVSPKECLFAGGTSKNIQTHFSYLPIIGCFLVGLLVVLDLQIISKCIQIVRVSFSNVYAGIWDASAAITSLPVSSKSYRNPVDDLDFSPQTDDQTIRTGLTAPFSEGLRVHFGLRSVGYLSTAGVGEPGRGGVFGKPETLVGAVY